MAIPRPIVQRRIVDMGADCGNFPQKSQEGKGYSPNPASAACKTSLLFSFCTKATTLRCCKSNGRLPVGNGFFLWNSSKYLASSLRRFPKSTRTDCVTFLPLSAKPLG